MTLGKRIKHVEGQAAALDKSFELMDWREAVRRWVRNEYVPSPASVNWLDLTPQEIEQVRSLEDRINQMGNAGETADKIIAAVESGISSVVAGVLQRRGASHEQSSSTV